MCNHVSTGLVVDCYHDGTPMDISPSCHECGMRAERIPEHEWQRMTYFVPIEHERVVRIMELYNTNKYYVAEVFNLTED